MTHFDAQVVPKHVSQVWDAFQFNMFQAKTDVLL